MRSHASVIGALISIHSSCCRTGTVAILRAILRGNSFSCECGRATRTTHPKRTGMNGDAMAESPDPDESIWAFRGCGFYWMCMRLTNVIELQDEWENHSRWAGIERPYSAEDVARLRGTVHIEHTLARMGAERLWRLLHEEAYVPALGALTGNQAVQQVQAGLKAIYLSGWQVAGDANLAGEMYPDQSLYPANSVPAVVRAINNAFTRADQLHHAEGHNHIHWFAPIVADAEAGFGGPLNAFELMKALITAGAAAVHLEDQLASAKKCGHMG